MNEMQAHGLLIPVGSKPFEVWIDKNNSLAELQDLVNGNVDVLSVLGNGVDLWVNEEGLINGIEPDRYQLQNEHAAGDKHEKSTKSLAEVATEARESSLVPARTRATTTTAATISVIRVQSTTSIRSATNQSCMNRFKETRR